MFLLIFLFRHVAPHQQMTCRDGLIKVDNHSETIVMRLMRHSGGGCLPGLQPHDSHPAILPPTDLSQQINLLDFLHSPHSQTKIIPTQ